MTPISNTDPLPTIGAILVAAGRGTRFGDSKNKVFNTVLGEPLWWYSAKQLRTLSASKELVIVIAEADQPLWDAEATRLQSLNAKLVIGGEQRIESVRAGFEFLRQQPLRCSLVAIHDAARPCILVEDIERVCDVAAKTGAAILARPLTGSIKRGNSDNEIEHSVDRRQLWEAMTPQVFRREVLQTAFDRWQGRPLTDDAQLVELSGHAVTLVPGSATNLKVTSRDDLDLAAAILERQCDCKS